MARKVSVEFDDESNVNTQGLQNFLTGVTIELKDAVDFLWMLNQGIYSFYKMLSDNLDDYGDRIKNR